MDFTTATDRATGACITLADVADAMGIAAQSVRRSRVDPSKPSYRPPPSGWEAAVATLARARAADLLALADDLEDDR